MAPDEMNLNTLLDRKLVGLLLWAQKQIIKVVWDAFRMQTKGFVDILLYVVVNLYLL